MTEELTDKEKVRLIVNELWNQYEAATLILLEEIKYAETDFGGYTASPTPDGWIERATECVKDYLEFATLWDEEVKAWRILKEKEAK